MPSSDFHVSPTYVIGTTSSNIHPAAQTHGIINFMGFYSTALIGFFLGFAFGVGCALAVLYSIFMGGYRTAVKDTLLPTPPARFLEAVAKARKP